MAILTSHTFSNTHNLYKYKHTRERTLAPARVHTLEHDYTHTYVHIHTCTFNHTVHRSARFRPAVAPAYHPYVVPMDVTSTQLPVHNCNGIATFLDP